MLRKLINSRTYLCNCDYAYRLALVLWTGIELSEVHGQKINWLVLRHRSAGGRVVYLATSRVDMVDRVSHWMPKTRRLKGTTRFDDM